MECQKCGQELSGPDDTHLCREPDTDTRVERLRDISMWFHSLAVVTAVPADALQDALVQWREAFDSLTAELALRERMVEVLCAPQTAAELGQQKAFVINFMRMRCATVEEAMKAWAESRAQGGDGDE